MSIAAHRNRVMIQSKFAKSFFLHRIELEITTVPRFSYIIYAPTLSDKLWYVSQNSAKFS